MLLYDYRAGALKDPELVVFMCRANVFQVELRISS